jgi:cobalamin biosynthesis Mg chelatase CobN
MRRVGTFAGVVCLAAVMAATAQAQDPAPNDPEADSPSGTVYEIPLDSARKDAAPRRTPDAPAPTPEPTTDPSSIHSENGFGSSSTVPGADEAAADAERERSERDRKRMRDDARSAQARARARDEAQSSGERRRAAGPESRPASRASVGPSSSRSFLLVALAVLVAVGLGVAARRAARGR